MPRIRHIVLFRAARREDVDAIFQGLSMLKAIPHAHTLEVALNDKIDVLGNDVDVVVHGEFLSRDELEAYKAHPIYQDSINAVRPLRDMRIAVDYDIPEPGGSASQKRSM